MLIDTHCHIHEVTYPLDATQVLARAREAGVHKMICVGTSEQSSREALAFAKKFEDTYAAIGVHPHDAREGWGEIQSLLKNSEAIAIGEIGLDYFYTHSPRDVQIEALESQIQIATDHNLPIIFHVREAFDDFWSIFDNFHGLRGVLHSYTDTMSNLDRALARNLFIGVNGISVFTKDVKQQETFASIPLESLVLETDAPFLTPPPFRGKVNEPALVEIIAEHHGNVRGVSRDEVARATTANAKALFAI